MPDVGKLGVKSAASHIAVAEDGIGFCLRGGVVEEGKSGHAALAGESGSVEIGRIGAGCVVAAGHAGRRIAGDAVVGLPDAGNPAVESEISTRTVEIGGIGDELELVDGGRVSDVDGVCTGVVR